MSPKRAQGREAVGVALAILLTVAPAATAQPASSMAAPAQSPASLAATDQSQTFTIAAASAVASATVAQVQSSSPPLPAAASSMESAGPSIGPAAPDKPAGVARAHPENAPGTPAASSAGANGGPGRTFEGFSSLRHVVLEAIAGARQRIWLSTDFLSDGEIVTALYLAQYRKLDIKVLLGRWKAQTTLSRLNYLKQQKVPVWLRPDSFKPGQPTALLTDDALLLVDGELDSQARARRFTMTQATVEAAQRFAGEFAAAANLEVPAISRASPMVGRAHTGGKTHDGGGVSSYNKYTSDGAYRYDRRAEPRPDGVSSKLPKQTKLQERKKAPPLPPESSMP